VPWFWVGSRFGGGAEVKVVARVGGGRAVGKAWPCGGAFAKGAEKFPEGMVAG
jgi:hypothetical protein